MRIAQANLVTKTDFDAKLSSLNRKITENKTDHLIVKNQLNELKIFDLSYYNGKSYFEEEDGRPNYLIFQLIYRYLNADNSGYLLSWTSKGLSNESIKPNPISNSIINPSLTKYLDTKVRVKFNGNCLKQDKIIYTHGKVVSIYIVYEIVSYISGDDLPTLENCLFGAVTLTKNADIDKYKYSGYGIGFDRKGSFSFPSGGYGKNVVIFGADMNSSQHIDNKKNTY